MGIKVLPPDVNESDANFTPVGTDIRFGLTAIRNVGANVVEAIVATRTDKGRFADFDDFLRKVDGRRVQQAHHRVADQGRRLRLPRPHAARGLVAVHEQAVDAVIDDQAQRGHRPGLDLFGGLDDEAAPTLSRSSPPVPDGEWDKTTLLAFEREMLGLYVSDHPLFGVEHVLAARVDCSIAALTADDGGPTARRSPSPGLITGAAAQDDQEGQPLGDRDVEDLEGAIEVLFFPQTYQLCRTLLAEDARRRRPRPARPPRGRRRRSSRWSSRIPDLAEGRPRPGRRVPARRRAARRRSSSASRTSSPPTPAPPRSTCGCQTGRDAP